MDVRTCVILELVKNEPIDLVIEIPEIVVFEQVKKVLVEIRTRGKLKLLIVKLVIVVF